MKFHIPALWEVKIYIDIYLNSMQKEHESAIILAFSPTTGIWGSDEAFLQIGAHCIALFWPGEKNWWKFKYYKLTFAKN